MDEQPFQFLNEIKESIPATVNHPKRVDYEYERAGTASIFMFTEPQSKVLNASNHLQSHKKAEPFGSVFFIKYPNSKSNNR